MTQVFTEFVRICRDAIHNCGWEGGLRVERDTTNLGVGGTPKNTAHTSMVWNRVGAGNSNREFSHMVLTESFQTNGGEAVSDYLKTVKRGTAPIWGGCDEANDPLGLSGAMVARELDIFAIGPANDPEHGDTHEGGRVRIGADIVGGDEQAKLGGAPSGAQGSAGWRVYATSTTPWFRWLYGGWVTDYLRTGLRLIGKKLGDWTPERALDIRGDHIVGIDFSNGTCQSVMRLREGQAFSLDAYDDFRFCRIGGAIVFSKWTPAGRATVFTLDMDAGEVFARKFTTIP